MGREHMGMASSFEKKLDLNGKGRQGRRCCFWNVMEHSILQAQSRQVDLIDLSWQNKNFECSCHFTSVHEYLSQVDIVWQN